MLFGEYATQSCTIFLLSTYPKYLAGPTRALTTTNKPAVSVVQRLIYITELLPYIYIYI